MTQTPVAVNLGEKFGLFAEHWRPRVVAELNGQHVKLVKLLGEFVWHHHADEDELFLVVRGSLRMQFRAGDVMVGEGEFIVVPKGVEHRPVADEEVHAVLFEPAATRNTGNVTNERTVKRPARLYPPPPPAEASWGAIVLIPRQTSVPVYEPRPAA